MENPDDMATFDLKDPVAKKKRAKAKKLTKHLKKVRSTNFYWKKMIMIGIL